MLNGPYSKRLGICSLNKSFSKYSWFSHYDWSLEMAWGELMVVSWFFGFLYCDLLLCKRWEKFQNYDNGQILAVSQYVQI